MRRRVAWFVFLVGFGLAEVGRAEVAIPFGPPGTGSGRHGLLVSIIGDSPDPFPQIWERHTLSSAIPLNPNGSTAGDGQPSTLVHPITGEPVVAWARNTSGGFDVVISRFHDGAWTEPVVVAGGLVDEIDPSVAADAEGTIHLAYATDGEERAIWHVEGEADLSSWSEPVRVSETEAEASRPDVIVHESVLRVVYESHDLGFGSTPKTIVLSRREGAEFVREVVATTGHAGAAAPHVGSHGGRLWVDWVDAVHATGAGELAWVRLGVEGPDPPGYIPFASAFDREFHIRPGVRLLVVAP
jgi:hypothetical protein